MRFRATVLATILTIGVLSLSVFIALPVGAQGTVGALQYPGLDTLGRTAAEGLAKWILHLDRRAGSSREVDSRPGTDPSIQRSGNRARTDCILLARVPRGLRGPAAGQQDTLEHVQFRGR